MRPKVSFLMQSIRDNYQFDRFFDSIMTQTLKEFELIIIDNNHSRVKPIPADDRVKVIDGKTFEGKNFMAICNSLLDMATGEICIFVADDDIYLSEMAEIFYIYFQKGYDFVHSGFIDMDEKRRPIAFVKGVKDLTFEQWKDSQHVSIAAYSVDKLNKLGIRYNENYKIISDQLFIFDCFKKRLKTIGISLPLALISRSKNKMSMDIAAKIEEYKRANKEFNNLFGWKLEWWGKNFAEGRTA